MKKVYLWDKEKNAKLIIQRRISFEAIITHIENGNLLGIVQGKGQYKHQKQFIVSVNQYAYIVPFVEERDHIFLKTIIPSRKMTKFFLLKR